jgi:hypothetical protein
MRRVQLSYVDRHDQSQAREIWPPRAGFFRLRLVRGGWPVPAEIKLVPIEDGGTDRMGWQAVIDGEPRDPDPDPAHAAGVSDIWHGGTIVPQSEFEWCIAVRDHAAAHDPDHPSLHPRKPIDRNRLKPL